MIRYLTKAENEFAQNLIEKLENDPHFFQCEPGKDCFNEAKQDQFKAMISDLSSMPLGWSFNELCDLKYQEAQLQK